MDAAWLEGVGHPVEGLGLIVAFEPAFNPRPIGSGFIVGAYGTKALFVTAAHVLEEIHNLQNPLKRHHATALPQFLPPPKSLDLDPKKIRVVLSHGDRIECAVVEGVAFNRGLDVACLQLAQQNEDDPPFFVSRFLPDPVRPSIGDDVVVYGYSTMDVIKEVAGPDGEVGFTLGLKTTLRRGTVSSEHPEGHLLCRGPCVETTIPVYPGMSGGVVLHFGEAGTEMRAFGLVCSDPSDTAQSKLDAMQPGASIVALLPVQQLDSSDAGRFAFRIPAPEGAGTLGLIAPEFGTVQVHFEEQGPKLT